MPQETLIKSEFPSYFKDKDDYGAGNGPRREAW